jgi:hypothetical protein
MKLDMYFKGLLTAIAVCLIYLVIGAPGVLRIMTAQTAQEPLPQSPMKPLPAQPLPQGAQVTPVQTVASGEDLGFRIERIMDDRAVGTLVVRINGRWLSTESSPRHIPLAH